MQLELGIMAGDSQEIMAFFLEGRMPSKFGFAAPFLARA